MMMVEHVKMAIAPFGKALREKGAMNDLARY